MKRIISTAVVCALMAVPAMASMMLSDNINSENGGVGATNYSSFANWTVPDGSVDLIGYGFYDFLPGNGLYIDMDGSTSKAGTMTTKTSFDFEPGVTYTLSYDLAGNHRNADFEQVIVSLGTILNDSHSLAQNAPWTLYSQTFTVDSATIAKLSFEGVGGDNRGMLLDNVNVSSSVVPVPLPGAILLGLGAAGVKLRKFV